MEGEVVLPGISLPGIALGSAHQTAPLEPSNRPLSHTRAVQSKSLKQKRAPEKSGRKANAADNQMDARLALPLGNSLLGRAPIWDLRTHHTDPTGREQS